MSEPIDNVLDTLFKGLKDLNEKNESRDNLKANKSAPMVRAKANDAALDSKKKLIEELKKAKVNLQKNIEIPGKEMIASRLKSRESNHATAVAKVATLKSDKRNLNQVIQNKKNKIIGMQSDLKKITEHLERDAKPNEVQADVSVRGIPAAPSLSDNAAPLAPPLVPEAPEVETGGTPKPPGPPSDLSASAESSPAAKPISLEDQLKAQKNKGVRKIAKNISASETASQEPKSAGLALAAELALRLESRKKAIQTPDHEEVESGDHDFDDDDGAVKPKVKPVAAKPKGSIKPTTGIHNANTEYQSFLSLKAVNRNLSDNDVNDIMEVSMVEGRVNIKVSGIGMEIDLLRKTASEFQDLINNEISSIKKQLDDPRVKDLLKKDLEKMSSDSGEAQIINFLNERIKGLKDKMSDLSAFAKDIKKEKNLQEQIAQTKLEEAKLNAEIEVLKTQDKKLDDFIAKMPDSAIKAKFHKYEEQRQSVITGIEPAKSSEVSTATVAPSVDDSGSKNDMLSDIRKGRKLRKTTTSSSKDPDTSQERVAGVMAAAMKNMPAAQKIDVHAIAEARNVQKVLQILSKIIENKDSLDFEDNRIRKFLEANNLFDKVSSFKDAKSFYATFTAPQQEGIKRIYKKTIQDLDKIKSEQQNITNDIEVIFSIAERLKQFKNTETFSSSPYNIDQVASLLSSIDSGSENARKKFIQDISLSSDEWEEFVAGGYKHAKINNREELLKALTAFDQGLALEKKEREELLIVLTQSSNPHNKVVLNKLPSTKLDQLQMLSIKIKNKNPEEIKNILAKDGLEFLSGLTQGELKEIKAAYAKSVADLNARNEDLKQANEAHDTIFDIVDQYKRYASSPHFSKLNSILEGARIPPSLDLDAFETFYNGLKGDTRKAILQAYEEGTKAEISEKVKVSEAQVLKDAGLSGVETAMAEVEAISADAKKIDDMISIALKKAQVDADEKKSAEEKARTDAEEKERAETANLGTAAPTSPPLVDVPHPPPGPPGSDDTAKSLPNVIESSLAPPPPAPAMGELAATIPIPPDPVLGSSLEENKPIAELAATAAQGKSLERDDQVKTEIPQPLAAPSMPEKSLVAPSTPATSVVEGPPNPAVSTEVAVEPKVHDKPPEKPPAQATEQDLSKPASKNAEVVAGVAKVSESPPDPSVSEKPAEPTPTEAAALPKTSDESSEKKVDMEIQKVIESLNIKLKGRGTAAISDVPGRPIKILFDSSVLFEDFAAALDENEFSDYRVGRENVGSDYTKKLSTISSIDYKYFLELSLVESHKMLGKFDEIDKIFAEKINKLSEPDSKLLGYITSIQQTFYSALGLKGNETETQIKQAFIIFLKSRNGSILRDHQAIYELLMIPEKRKLVDQVITEYENTHKVKLGVGPVKTSDTTPATPASEKSPAVALESNVSEVDQKNKAERVSASATETSLPKTTAAQQQPVVQTVEAAVAAKKDSQPIGSAQPEIAASGPPGSADLAKPLPNAATESESDALKADRKRRAEPIADVEPEKASPKTQQTLASGSSPAVTDAPRDKDNVQFNVQQTVSTVSTATVASTQVSAAVEPSVPAADSKRVAEAAAAPAHEPRTAVMPQRTTVTEAKPVAEAAAVLEQQTAGEVPGTTVVSPEGGTRQPKENVQPLPQASKETSAKPLALEGENRSPAQGNTLGGQPASAAPELTARMGKLNPANSLAALRQTQDTRSLGPDNSPTQPMQFSNRAGIGGSPLPGGVTALASNITEQAVNDSFAEIQKNIEEKVGLYQLATLDPRAEARHFSIAVKRDDGKQDKITRTVTETPDKKLNMQVTLSRDAKDESFLLFCDINKTLSPLTMKFPCKDPEIALKVLEASVQKGMTIILHKNDSALFDKPENAHLKPLFEYLQNKDNHKQYLGIVNLPENSDRKLGKLLKGLPTQAQSQALAEEQDIVLTQQDSPRNKPAGT